MRVCRLLVWFIVAAAAAGCAGMPMPPVAAVPPEASAPLPPDLDAITYSRRYPGPEPVAVPVPAAVAVPPPVPAALLPGPAPGGDLPYTLDSGDRLRIVVFGQEGLT